MELTPADANFPEGTLESAQQVNMLCETFILKKFSCQLRFLASKTPKTPQLAIKLVIVPILGSALISWIPLANGQGSTSQTKVGAISGIVLSQGTNRPVTQAIVTLRSDSAGIWQSVLTDSAGQFEVRDIPAGKYVISIAEPGYEPLQTNEQLDDTSLNLSLYLVASRSRPLQSIRNTVSVHELKIPNKARNEFEKGLKGLDKGDLPESLSHFLKATHIFSDYYEAYYFAGAVQLRLDQRDEAMQLFQQAIDLSSGRYAPAQIGIGYLLYLAGQLNEAEQVLRRGLDVDPNLPNGHAILGLVLLKLNRLEEAERSEHEALLRDPNFAGAYLVLSDVYGKKQDYGQQLVGLDSFLKLQPASPLSHRVQHARELTQAMLSKTTPQF